MNNIRTLGAAHNCPSHNRPPCNPHNGYMMWEGFSFLGEIKKNSLGRTQNLYVALEPIIFAINFDIVLFSKVFSTFDYVCVSIDCIANVN